MRRIILWTLLVFFLLWFHLRGLSIHDGGYVIHSAYRILRGEIIYKDFDFVYTPLSVFIITTAFKLFGESILVERVFSLMLSITTCIMLLKLLRLLTFDFLLLILGFFIYLSWGPTHINFFSPVMLSISLAILTVYFTVKYLTTNDDHYLFYGGITTGLTLLTKQNFGMMLLVNGFMFFLTNKKARKKKNVFKYLSGFSLPLILFLIYLLLTNSFNTYINDFYFYTIKKIGLEGVLTTPFFYGGNIFYKLLKTTFYLIPLLTSITGLVFSFKKQKKYFFLFTFVILFYFVSIRPETDLVHLVPILSLTGIPFVLLVNSFKQKLIKKLLIFSSFMLMGLGFYTALFIGYYRWENPLVENTYWNNNPKIMIWSDQRWFKISKQLTTALNQLNKPNDYLFINANAPLLYFVSGRRNPTRFDFVTPYADQSPYQEEIINNLKENNVFYILTNKNYRQENTLVIKFIQQNYQPMKVIDQFVLWQKKYLVKE